VGLDDWQGKGAASRELRMQHGRNGRQRRHPPEMSEQDSVETTKRPVAAEANNVIADLLRIRQQGPANPNRLKTGEADILATEEANLGHNADTVSVYEEGLGDLHPRGRV
jgi:hypothetical protein